MKHRKTATGAVGHSALSGTGEAFWRRATGRTTVGLFAVAALAFVGPGHTFAAPASENGPAGAVVGVGNLSALTNQVASANAELADLHSQLAAQRESVNKAIVDLQRARTAASRATQAVAAAQKALKWADDKIVAAQKTFDSQAALAYTQGSAGGGIASYLSASNPEQLMQRGQALALVSEAQQMTVDTLKRARAEQTKRVEAAQKKQEKATAAQAAAEQAKNNAVAAIVAVQRAAAAQAAKTAALTHHRDEAQAAIAATTPAAPATVTTAPATTVADAPTVDAAATTTAAADTTAAAPATTAAPASAAMTNPPVDPATAAASDWVQLLVELMNTGSAGTGSSTGSSGTGSSGEQSTPPAVNQVAPVTTVAAAPVTTVVGPTSTAAAATTTVAATAPAVDTTADTADTTDNSEYYEGDGTDSTGDLGLSQAPTITGSAGVETVVNRAISQLGVTYAWGGGDANGPTLGIRDGGVADSYGDYKKVGFDCSGLMVYAFAGVGISLPHYSGYQYTSGKQVPIAQAARGDMIFWGGGGSQHVALYLGAGKMIEAMESGTVIHITDVRYSGIQPYAVRLIE